MTCTLCDKICTSLKNANLERARRLEILDGFTWTDVLRSFSVPFVSFLIFAFVFSLAALADGRLFWYSLILFAPFLVRRIKRSYENRPDLEFRDDDAWLDFVKPAITGILVSLLFVAPLLFAARAFYGSTTYLAMTTNAMQVELEDKVELGIKDELTSLVSLDERKLIAETKASGASTMRRLREDWEVQTFQKNNRCTSVSREPRSTGIHVPDNAGGWAGELTVNEPVFRTDQGCEADYARRISTIDAQIQSAELDQAAIMDAKSSKFWWMKAFAAVFLLLLFGGIFYYPLGLGLAAASDNILDSINVFRVMQLAKVLDWDYARVYFTSILFLLIFALTIVWGVQAKGAGFYEPQPVDKTAYFYFVTVLSSIIRVYLLLVLANMVGRMLYKNAPKIEELT